MAENLYRYSVDIQDNSDDAFKAVDVRYEMPGQTEEHARDRLYKRIANLNCHIICARILGAAVQDN